MSSQRLNRLYRLLLTLFLAASFGAAPAARGTPTLGDFLASPVDAARRVAPQLGVHVIEVDSGATVYDYKADQPRVVASNTKLFTTAAALDALGPGYQMETRLLMRGAVHDGMLEGDLAVIGGGDPNISGRFNEGDSLAVFRDWAAELAQRGVSRVSGDVFLVHGLFGDPEIHPDWPRDQLARWYEAPIDALSFNDSCILVRVWPGSRPGLLARVELVPPVPLLTVRSSVTTSSSRRMHHVFINRLPESDVLTVSGAVWSGAEPVESWITVPSAVGYFGSALRTELELQGIRIEGRMAPVDDLPGEAWERVASYRSDLLTAIEVTNKRSQNYYAETLFKLLGAASCGDGSWAGGVRAVREFLRGIGIPPGSYSMADGSGMSRNDRFEPRQVTLLLRHMFFHRWGREFIRSLPYSGESDLSWERRLADEPYRGNVFAKTGTLDGVSALSGYVKAASGKFYAFSILCNQARSTWQARRAQDQIVRALIDHG